MAMRLWTKERVEDIWRWREENDASFSKTAEHFSMPVTQITYVLTKCAQKYGLVEPRPARPPTDTFPTVFNTDDLKTASNERVIMVPVPRSKLALVAEVLWQS